MSSFYCARFLRPHRYKGCLSLSLLCHLLGLEEDSEVPHLPRCGEDQDDHLQDDEPHSPRVHALRNVTELGLLLLLVILLASNVRDSIIQLPDLPRNIYIAKGFQKSSVVGGSRK